MTEILCTLNGKPQIVSVTNLFRVFHSKINLVCGHYTNNEIKKPNFTQSNCILIAQKDTRLYHSYQKSEVQKYMESQSKIIWHINFKDFYYLLKLDTVETDFSNYIELMKYFSQENKLSFGYQFTGRERFLRPIKERIDDFDMLLQNYLKESKELNYDGK